MAVGINPDGTLKKRAFLKPGFGTVAFQHPDTGVRFEGFVLEEYQQALRLACEAHRMFYHTEFIGWDVAMTEDGPVFIEGNDNWEIPRIQATNRPLKAEWTRAVQEWKKNR